MELHAAMNQQLKDAIRWLEGVEAGLEHGSWTDGDLLAIHHVRTIIAAVKSLHAEVEALRKESK